MLRWYFQTYLIGIKQFAIGFIKTIKPSEFFDEGYSFSNKKKFQILNFWCHTGMGIGALPSPKKNVLQICNKMAKIV